MKLPDHQSRGPDDPESSAQDSTLRAGWQGTDSGGNGATVHAPAPFAISQIANDATTQKLQQHIQCFAHFFWRLYFFLSVCVRWSPGASLVTGRDTQMGIGWAFGVSWSLFFGGVREGLSSTGTGTFSLNRNWARPGHEISTKQARPGCPQFWPGKRTPQLGRH